MQKECKINTTLTTLQPLALLLLRLVVGVIMVVHGWGKLHNIENFAGFLTSIGFTTPSPIFHVYMAIACELLGGLGVLVGLLTRLAALGIVNAMAVAVFVVHWKNGLLADNNGFEYPLTLLAAGLLLICFGGGPYSLDAFICKLKCKKQTACCEEDHSEL